jgi:hypothetical protein
MLRRVITPQGSQAYTVKDATPGRLPETFMVALRAFDWNGSCTCRTFTDVCAYLLCHGEGRQRCDHILAARAWAMEHEFPEMAELADKNIIRMPRYENNMEGATGL